MSTSTTDPSSSSADLVLLAVAALPADARLGLGIDGGARSGSARGGSVEASTLRMWQTPPLASMVYVPVGVRMLPTTISPFTTSVAVPRGTPSMWPERE